MRTRRAFSLAVWLWTGVAAGAGCSSGGGGGPADAGDSGSPSADGASFPLDGGAEAAASDAAASDDGTVADGASALDGATPDAGNDASAEDAEASAPPTYTNPVIPTDFPDPFVLPRGGNYYAFGTNAGTSNIQAAVSTDLATWTLLPDALPHLPSWAAPPAGLTWAPSILVRGANTFVMYYVTRDATSNFQCISRATSTSPAGPYVDSSTSPFVCQTSLCGSIDPSPFVDWDGTAYLVWKSDENAPACATPPRLWSAALSSDGAALAGPPTQLLVMNETWQQPIIEGPSMRFLGGTYFLVYSANNYESASYAMGYATCLSAVGPCENVSVSSPFVSSAGSALGPGGGEFFDDAQGAHWLLYHAWTAPKTTYAGGGARSMRVDRLSVGDGGVLALDGPTTTPQPL